jgi:cytochrome c-type biogenesis protein CcmH
MVCQNESIDDSEASLAKDLRILVRERLQGGDSDEQVRAYLVQRYGDFILLKPPLKPETLLLWGAPFLVLLGGAAAIFISSRRRVGQAASPVLNEIERARLEDLLGDDSSPRS